MLISQKHYPFYDFVERITSKFPFSFEIFVREEDINLIVFFRRFDKFIETQQKRSKELSKGIEYYLEQPCERVKSYPKMLKDILDCTPKSHKDYHLIFQALYLLDDLVANVENERKIIENNAKILQIESAIEGCKVSFE